MDDVALETVEAFIVRNAIEFHAQARTERPDLRSFQKDAFQKDAYHFLCTFTRAKEGRMVERRLQVFYTMGPGHATRKKNLRRRFSGDPAEIVVPPVPTASDVLDCLASDASGYDNARNFEEWASDYGYDTDSRKAERIYSTIAEQTKELRHFLGNAEYAKLLNETERL